MKSFDSTSETVQAYAQEMSSYATTFSLSDTPNTAVMNLQSSLSDIMTELAYNTPLLMIEPTFPTDDNNTYTYEHPENFLPELRNVYELHFDIDDPTYDAAQIENYLDLMK